MAVKSDCRILTYLQIEIDGRTLKLFGHPTPFFAQEVNIVSTIKSVNTFARMFNPDFFILIAFS